MSSTPTNAPGLTTSQRTHAVLAGYLGWTMDAFDFFVVVFMLGTLADSFHVSKSKMVLTLTLTLAMRPVGAFLFGLLADRFGRRVPLMLNVVYFSIIEVLCGFAPTFSTFLVLRALYGIGMGGEWGIGASLAMESIPQRWRGVISGALQGGYSTGYLLAALAFRFVFPSLGWRWMFWIGGIPALLALYIRWHVPESEAWKEHASNSMAQIIKIFASYWKTFAYLIVMMTLFMFLSHGTQDLYPDFLKTEHHLSASWVSYIAIIYNIGAIVGAIIFGLISQRIGRRKGIVFALFVSLVSIPAWAFGSGIGVIALAAFMMQVGVQGAWGVVPVHLNELAPDAARGLVPGFAYQLGILIASPTNNIEFWLRNKWGYQWALAGFEIVVIVCLAVVVAIGREAHGKQFSKLSA
ncbi:MAG TPA: MFS transporter [Candidatus Koribacter sp.]|jgi:SHS family lactate transporter-like MFS transporter